MYKFISLILSLSSNLEVGKEWNLFALTESELSADREISVRLLNQAETISGYGIGCKNIYGKANILRYFESLAICNDDTVWLSSNNRVKNEALILHFLVTRLAYHHTLLLHASYITYQNQAILFLGPSGIGKTTQAELWNRYRGADIVNGDRAFVSLNDEDGNLSDRFYAYGSPWHGSSPYCLNVTAPVRAVVILKQTKGNRLMKLSGAALVTELTESAFFPIWEQEAMDRALETFEEFIARNEFYLLENDATEESVNLLLSELFPTTE